MKRSERSLLGIHSNCAINEQKLFDRSSTDMHEILKLHKNYNSTGGDKTHFFKFLM